MFTGDPGRDLHNNYKLKKGCGNLVQFVNLATP